MKKYLLCILSVFFYQYIHAVPVDGICKKNLSQVRITIEHIGGHLVPVYNAPIKIKKSASGQYLFKLSQLFEENPNDAILGFGRPNVFLAIPGKNGETQKYAAKSAWRGPSEIVEGDLIQSGYFIRMKNLPAEAMEGLRTAMEAREGEKSITCVKANCGVLSDAGFTDASGKALDVGNILPHQLADTLLSTGGILYKGKPVELEVWKTTRLSGEDYRRGVISDTRRAIARHWARFRGKPEAPSPIQEPKDEDLPPVIFHPVEDQTLVDLEKNIDLSISSPSALGLRLRMIWGPHALYNVKSNKIKAEEFFSDRKLKEFPKENPDFVTKLKQNFLFSKPVVSGIRSQLQKSTLDLGPQTEKTLFDMLPAHTEEFPNMHNIVITDSGVSIARLNVRHKFVDWLLTKHVLISGYSDSVRFAGEVWKGTDGKIHVNNNSGTYKPDGKDLQNAKKYLESMFPNTEIVIHALGED